MKLNPRGMAFWVMLGAIAGVEEAVTALSGHTDLTLSYQVWWLAAHQPTWLNAGFIGAFGLAATSLAVHFWGHRRGP